MKFDISEKAIEDIQNIWLFTRENWSNKQADRYYNLIIDEIEYIAENPLAGKNADHIRKNYRFTKVKSHVIFFKFKKLENKVEIIRILHQSMNIDERIIE